MYHTIASTSFPGVLTAKENKISSTHVSVFTRFYKWTIEQEENRFMWLAFAFILQIGLALPCTLLCVVYFGGNNFNLWMIICLVNVPSLVLCLAVQPTKIMLPVLFFAWLADVAIIIYSVTGFLIHQ